MMQEENTQKDIITSIWKKMKKTIGYGEIDFLFKLLNEQKPHLKIVSLFDSESNPKRARNDFGESASIIIYLRVFDQIIQKKKILKIYFMDHFDNAFFTGELNALFKSVKTILRKDIVLEIYDTYALTFDKNNGMYYVIESEDYENNLADLYSGQLRKDFPENLSIIMEQALQYCCDRPNLKQKQEIKDLTFPFYYTPFFYLVKNENNDMQVKLNVLAHEIFVNPNQKDFHIFPELRQPIEMRYMKKQNTQKSEKEKDFKELNSQLDKLLIGVQNLSAIKKDQLVVMINDKFSELVKHHGLQIFEIIASHPKYNDFELIEYDSNFFNLGTIINGKNYNIKCEKFKSILEVEETIKEYEKYYSIQNHLFIPINSYEAIIVDNGFYVLVEEEQLPYDYSFNKKKKTNQNAGVYKSLEDLTNLSISKILDQVRVLQVVFELFRFAKLLAVNEIFHGMINFHNIIVCIPFHFSTKPPRVYFSNPLFLRNKNFNFKKQEGSKKSPDKGRSLKNSKTKSKKSSDQDESSSFTSYSISSFTESSSFSMSKPSSKSKSSKRKSPQSNEMDKENSNGSSNKSSRQSEVQIKKLEMIDESYVQDSVMHDNDDDDDDDDIDDSELEGSKVNEVEEMCIFNDFEELTNATFFLAEKLCYLIEYKPKTNFMNRLDSYFEDLSFFRSTKIKDFESKLECNNKTLIMQLNRLKELLSLYEHLYKEGLSDKYLRLNKKWKISIKRYRQLLYGGYQFHITDNTNNQENYGEDYDIDLNGSQHGRNSDSDSDDDDDSDEENDEVGFMFRPRYDQCSEPQILELGIEKIAYDFQNQNTVNKCQLLNSLAKNSKLTSIKFSGFRSGRVRPENNEEQQYEHSNVQLENVLKAHKGLQKLKIFVDDTDNRMIDFRSLYESNQLQHILISYRISSNTPEFQNEGEIIGILNHYRDLMQLFLVFNTKFSTIQVKPFMKFLFDFSTYSLDWYFNKLNSVSFQIQNGANQEDITEDFSIFSKIDFGYVKKMVPEQIDQIGKIRNCLDLFYQTQIKRQNPELIKQTLDSIQQKLNQIIENNGYLLCTIRFQDNTNLLVLEFQNLLDYEMGQLVVNIDFINQEESKLKVTYNCQSQERFDCASDRGDSTFQTESVREWIKCEYDSKIKRDLFGKTYSNSCRHCDWTEIQKYFYANQTKLNLFTFYFDQCPNLTRQMQQTRDFFGFSRVNQNSLLSVNLRINLEYDKKLLKLFSTQLRKQLDNAKSLISILIQTENIHVRILYKSLIKMKRLVLIGLDYGF